MSCEEERYEDEEKVRVRIKCRTGQEWPDMEADEITVYKDDNIAVYIWEWRAWVGYPAWNGYRWLCEYDPQEREKLLKLARSGDFEDLYEAIWDEEKCEEIPYRGDP